MLHVGSLSLWVGGLAALVVLAAYDRRVLRVAVPRYSGLALWVYVITVGSGIANAWIRMDSPTELVTTGYGRLVLLKTALAIALGWFGWWHRRSTIPQLTGPRRTAAFLRFAGVEVLVMAAAIGVGVGLSRTPPPVNDAIDLTGASPARIVLGYDLPPLPDPMRLVITQIRIDALWVAVVLLLATLYVVGIRQLRRGATRGRSAARSRGCSACCCCCGRPTAASPRYSHVLFSAHMVQHMMLSMIVPILLVLGAPATLALRALPSHHGDPGPREWLVAFLNSRYVHFLSNIIVAAVIFVTELLRPLLHAAVPRVDGQPLGAPVHAGALPAGRATCSSGRSSASTPALGARRTRCASWCCWPRCRCTRSSTSRCCSRPRCSRRSTSPRSNGRTSPTCWPTSTSAPASGGRSVSSRCSS